MTPIPHNPSHQNIIFRPSLIKANNSVCQLLTIIGLYIII